MAALIGGCKKEKEPEKVVVKMEKAGTDNVEIYGEYVGRIRAMQFDRSAGESGGIFGKHAF